MGVEFDKKPITQPRLEFAICNVCWTLTLPQFVAKHMEWHARRGEIMPKADKPLIVRPG